MTDDPRDYRPVEGTCKVCGHTVHTRRHKDCPDEWLAKLLPALTCDRCMASYSANVRHSIIADRQKVTSLPEPEVQEQDTDLVFDGPEPF